MENFIIDNENIVKFNLIKKNWVKLIQFNNYYYSPFFLKNCFKFKGKINVNQFINSLNDSFNVYDILLSTINKDENGNVCINLCDGYKDILEIEYRNGDSILKSNVKDTIPLKLMNDSQKMGFDLQFNSNSQMVLFKLTIFNDGFSIGFCISHSFFDVSSFVYYFKYLSQIYSYGIDKVKLNKPQIMDFSVYKSDEIEIIDNNHAINFANNNGIIFENELNFNLFIENSTINLEFSINEIENLKINNKQLTKNDIITALLLKIYTFTSKLKDDDIFTLRYPYNIRKIGNIGENVIGNLFKYSSYTMKVSEIRNKSLLDIANINHNKVSSNTIQQFKDQVNWFEFIQINKISTLKTFVPSFNKTNISNWNQNSFDQIIFENSTPYSLETVSMASGGTNMISFNISNTNDVILTTSISIPSECIDKVIELGNSSKLFKIQS